MSGRGTITSRTMVSSSSNTLWIISRSERSTTPSRAPTSTIVRSSASLISGSLGARSEPATRKVRAVSPPSVQRMGAMTADSHATGRLTHAEKIRGCSTARVMGSTSPKTLSRNVMPPMAMASPALPKSLPATDAASAEAAMFTTVIPTRSVTSSSCGCLRSGASGLRSAPCSLASSLRRARPREK